MRFLLMAVFVCVALVGCSNKAGLAVSAPAKFAKQSADSASRFMAYEHFITLDVDEKHIASVHGAIEAACRADVAEQCVVLESRLNTGRYASAELKLRAKPEGIRKLITSLSSQGNVINQSVRAEDLASPIEDSARKLEMLIDYRTKLEALRGKAASDIDALIKLNKELASVQSEVEAMSGEKAHLLQRVETEILTVTVSADDSRSFLRPIVSAMSDFGQNFSEGISSVITGIAFLAPWGVTLLVFLWAGRKLWLRRKKSGTNA